MTIKDHYIVNGLFFCIINFDSLLWITDSLAILKGLN
jgi:hypothetical protein